MAGFSAWTFTGAAGVAYRSGIAAIGLYIGNALSFLLGYFVFATALAAQPHHHGDGISLGALQPDHSSSFFLDHDRVPAVYQRQHSVWSEPLRIFGLRFSRNLDHSWRGRPHRFLLRAGRPVGRGRHRFSASLDPHAVLHGSRRHVSRPSGRSERSGAFAAAGNEDAACFGRIWLALHRLMDDHGFVRLQHQRDGATLLQRGRRTFGAQNRIAVLRIVFRGSFLVVHSAHGDARRLSDLHAVWACPTPAKPHTPSPA